MQNTVAVYPNIDSAKIAYLGAKPTNISLKYPKIGDEFFLYNLYPENKRLVFRERNVVVWVQLQGDEFGKDDIWFLNETFWKKADPRLLHSF